MVFFENYLLRKALQLNLTEWCVYVMSKTDGTIDGLSDKLGIDQEKVDSILTDLKIRGLYDLKTEKIETNIIESYRSLFIQDTSNLQEYTDVYFKWHRQIAEPNYNAVEASFMKKIKVYFDRAYGVNGVATFAKMLSMWDMLDDFTQKQRKVQQIYSNLGNIISVLREKSKKNSSYKELLKR